MVELYTQYQNNISMHNEKKMRKTNLLRTERRNVPLHVIPFYPLSANLLTEGIIIWKTCFTHFLLDIHFKVEMPPKQSIHMFPFTILTLGLKLNSGHQ